MLFKIYQISGKDFLDKIMKDQKYIVFEGDQQTINDFIAILKDLLRVYRERCDFLNKK